MRRNVGGSFGNQSYSGPVVPATTQPRIGFSRVDERSLAGKDGNISEDPLFEGRGARDEVWVDGAAQEGGDGGVLESLTVQRGDDHEIVIGRNRDLASAGFVGVRVVDCRVERTTGFAAVLVLDHAIAELSDT